MSAPRSRTTWRAAILGSGRQGTAAAYDLLTHGGAGSVIFLDADPAAAGRAARRIGELAGPGLAEARRADASRPEEVVEALRGSAVVLSAVPYALNPGVARAAIAAGCHYSDLGGNTAVTRAVLALDAEARSAGVSLVPDTGLAPGLGTTLAMLLFRRLDRADSIRIRCGGLPAHPKPPLGYKLVFYVGGLTNEYLGEAEVLRGGRRERVRTLDDVETLELPDGLGPAEAFPTSGGTSTLCETLEGKVDSLDYRTVRYPGHVGFFRILRDLGLLDDAPVRVGDASVRPRDLFHAVAGPRLEFPGDPDLVFLRVEAEGESGGRRVRMRCEILDRFDPATGFSAMERMTGFPAAIVCSQQARGFIPPGARPLEQASDPRPWPEELRRRGIAIDEREEPC